jgi:hypothetical protein
MTTLPLPHLLIFIGPVAFWAAILVLTLGALCAAVLTLRRPNRWLVVSAAAALAVAVLLVAIPHPAPNPVATTLIGITVLALSVAGGGPAVQYVLALASRGSVTEGTHGGIILPEHRPDAPARREVLRGGTTIGIFERIATTAAIMAGVPEALAVIVAIKGVGRFTELDAAEARERFIIGTLVSLVWACACAAVFRLTIGH